jgi:uncharacterized membrane protein
MDRDSAWVFLPEATIELPQRPAEVGSRYEEDGHIFWRKGETARFETPDFRADNCRSNRAKAIWEAAKLDGVDFRAVGNEPGWMLEIRDGNQALLITDYGEKRLTFELSEPETNAEARTTDYEAISGKDFVRIRLEGITCLDSMNDENFPTRIQVHLGDKVYHGCGKALH